MLFVVSCHHVFVLIRVLILDFGMFCVLSRERCSVTVKDTLKDQHLYSVTEATIIYLRSHIYFTQSNGSQLKLKGEKCPQTMTVLGSKSLKSISVLKWVGRVAIKVWLCEAINLDMNPLKCHLNDTKYVCTVVHSHSQHAFPSLGFHFHTVR